MKEEKEVKISFWAAHITTIVSVTLLLLIIGVIAMVSVSARHETRRLKEKIEISMVLGDSITNQQAAEIAKMVAGQPYAVNVHVISKEEAMETWKGDTGEDLEAIFGVNPLSPEVAFTLKADYGSPEQLNSISQSLSQIEGVEAVAMPDSSLVESMNNNIESLSIVLGAIAVVLVFISFVLINNTVHLTVYSRRFTIHTMQLVGATNGFIRKPVVVNNMLAGVIAGLLSSLILGIVIWVLPQTSSINIGDYIDWPEFGLVSLMLIIIGAMLCGFAAFVSTTRYLRKDYEQLFN